MVLAFGTCAIEVAVTHLILCTLLACSLNKNSLCGVNKSGGGYTTEGVTALCEGLKQSNVTSLRCGACILNMRVIAVAIALLIHLPKLMHSVRTLQS